MAGLIIIIIILISFSHLDCNLLLVGHEPIIIYVSHIYMGPN